jgi:hypothetical protein
VRARRGRATGRRRGRAGKKKGEGEGKRERERERGGELTSGSKSCDHHLQNLRHHGERERWRRGGCCAVKSNERKGEKGGGAHGGGAGRRGRAGQSGPGWVRLGRVAGQKPTTRTAIDREPNRETGLSKTHD